MLKLWSKLTKSPIILTLPVRLIGPQYFVPKLNKEDDIKYKHGCAMLREFEDTIKEVKERKLPFKIHLSMENVETCPITFLMCVMEALLNVLNYKEITEYVQFTNTDFCKIDTSRILDAWNALLKREKDKHEYELLKFQCVMRTED